MSNVKNYTEQGGERTVIGGELEIIEGGKLIIEDIEIKSSDLQSDSTAEDVAGMVTDFNNLLLKLKTAGLMKAE